MSRSVSRTQDRKRKTTTMSKVTRKGQITIPVRFRKRNAIREGSSVDITDVGRRLVIEPIPPLLDLVASDKGKYESRKLKQMLDESRKNWR
jgi:AbrB family looped-hinge helix DNA binding protein